ncbi:MAG: ACT domain-containing protein, partial [Pseudomonadota bacterium]|nr:ACT domain-containing protein [Pseudomonadota bacterium]
RQCLAGSGYDKTSLILSAHGRDAPGSLQRLLAPLATHEINMTSLQSRPSRTGLWEYVFFLDFEGHQEEALVSRALADIQKESALFKVLGSYPRSL